MPTADPKLDLIRRVPLFSSCSSRDLEEIGRLAEEIDVTAGTVLIREGTTADEFFVVIDGALTVKRGEVFVARLGPGDFVGEIALIDGGVRTATVTADDRARLLVLGHREFHSLLDEFPSIERQVLLALARRVRAVEPGGVH